MKKIQILVFTIIVLSILIIIVYINRVPYKSGIFQKDTFLYSLVDKAQVYLDSGETADSPSLITVKQIHSGDFKVPLSNALNLEHPSCTELEDIEIEVPVFAYLIHHAKYGYFLIDSGCDSSFVNNSYGSMRGLLVPAFIPKTALKPEDTIEKELSDVLGDIQGVFFTHLHPDHTSGVSTLPKNRIYVAGKGEESLSIKFLLEINHFSKDDIVYMLDFNSTEAQNHSIGKAIDIFGDNSLLAISTPGHTKGHVSYLGNTKEGPILIAGDACILNESIETGAGPGTSASDSKMAQQTFDKINNFLKGNPNVKLFPGHDFPK